MSTESSARLQEALKPMSEYLGLDTSNYTTSAAIFDGGIRQLKKLLPVKDGEKGLRQSDALFHHTRQLPELLEELIPKANINAIGVSTRPRNIEGSYMPCFMAGETVARSIAAYGGMSLYRTSHQVGHVLAALYSCRRLDLAFGDKPFIAFHVSGGTTDCLLVTPDNDEVINCREISTSLDLKAGQAIDRVGVMLGLKFPCGMALEKLANESTRKFKIKPTMRSGNCCLSGVENICKKMKADGEPDFDIALYCIKYIESAVIAMTENALKEYGDLPLVYAGGVMSDRLIRESIQKRFNANFAEPAFSADNACGTAIFAAIKDGFIK